jgi:hypothetical protein
MITQFTRLLHGNPAGIFRLRVAPLPVSRSDCLHAITSSVGAAPMPHYANTIGGAALPMFKGLFCPFLQEIYMVTGESLLLKKGLRINSKFYGKCLTTQGIGG